LWVTFWPMKWCRLLVLIDALARRAGGDQVD
jgi:hypothetical protein